MPTPYLGLTVPLYTDAADGPDAFRDLVDSGPIPRFNTAALRDAAITTPIKGQVVFRNDLGTGALELYSGTAWVPVVPASAGAHNHDAAELTTGTLAAARIPDLDATKITTGVLASARLPAASVSVVGGVQLDSGVTSTSVTTAATASAAKTAYDQAKSKYDHAADPDSVPGRKIYIQVGTPVLTNGDIWFKI